MPVRLTRVPLIAPGCFALALVQASAVQAFLHGWLNTDIGMGFYLAGVVGAVPMAVYGVDNAHGGTKPLGWSLLIVTNTLVYYAIARLFLWARGRKS